MSKYSRQKVEPRISPVVSRGVAAPVDTYVRPGVTQGQQLAQALAEISPSIGRFTHTLSEQYAEEKKAEGVQAARIHGEQAQAAGDLTRLGELPMQDNPYFMAGYKEENGRVAAGVWQSDFKAMLEQDQGLKESVDLKDFDKALGSHLGSWFKEHAVERDEWFEKGFGGMKDQYALAERLAFANGIEKKLDRKSDEQLFAMVKRSISDNWGKEGLSPESIAKDIDLIVGNAVLRGRPEGKARTAAVMAIQAAALEAGPEKGLLILDLLEKATGEGGQGKLKDQSYGAKALQETRRELILQGHQDSERLRVEKEREKTARVEEISTAALKLLQGNPSADLEKYLRLESAFDTVPPEVVSNLRALQAQFGDLSYTTNQEVYNNLYQRILDAQPGEDPVTVHEVIAKSRNRNLRPEDAQRLVELLEQKKGRDKKDPLDEKAEPYFRAAFDLMKDAWKDKLGNFVPRENEFRVRNSRALLWERWFSLKATGKVEGMSQKELNQWFIDTGDEIVKSQLSKLQGELKFMPPTSPVINSPLGKALEDNKKEVPFPKALVLKGADFRDFQLNKTESVARVMTENGIPLERMSDFIKDQARLLEEQRTQ